MRSTLKSLHKIMSNFHLIPTFSFAPRHHTLPKDGQQGTGVHHPYRVFEMMDKIFEPGFDHDTKIAAGTAGASGGQRLHPRHRGFGELHIGEDPSKFEVLFDLGEQFKPEDVEFNVKLVDDDLIHIEARHETGSKESGEYRNHFFSKTITLPEGTDIEGLKSTLGDEGFLRVEAPIKIEEKPAVRDIPIQKVTRGEFKK